jgi:inner membrane protein
MDSLTQATLGAAVAHLCWQRTLGRKTLLWGIALGTLPDLDVLAYPWLDDVERLYWHRGESHAMWMMALAPLLLAPFVRWVHRRAPTPTSFTAAFLGVMLIWTTHVLIDVFTVYGTQMLAPFSRHGFSNGKSLHHRSLLHAAVARRNRVGCRVA